MGVRKKYNFILFGIFSIVVLGIFGFSQDALAYDVCADEKRCTHEEMAEFAGQVYTANSNDPEFNINQVMWGAGHEDEVDHIYGWHTFPDPLPLVTVTHFCRQGRLPRSVQGGREEHL